MSFINLNIEYEALKYAIKINNKEYNYNKENAYKIFGKYYYLVLAHLEDLKYYTIRRQQNISVELNAIDKINAIKKPLYTAIVEEQKIQQNLANIELEINHDVGLSLDEQNELYKKYEALKSAQISQRLKILNTLGSNKYNSLNDQWNNIKIEQYKNNLRLAQIARLTDSNLYANSEKIDKLYDEHNEARAQIIDNKTTLRIEIDEAIKQRFEELRNVSI